MLYPTNDDDDHDSDYDPDHDDDSASYASSEDSDYDPDDSSEEASTDLSAGPNPTELAGVNEHVNTTGVADRTTGVADRTPGVAITTPGVAVETPGVTENPELEEYVSELEAELDAEISGLDSDYNPVSNKESESDTDADLDDSFTPINHDEATAANAHATREQASADNDMSTFPDQDDDPSDDENEESDDGNIDRPLPRLRPNRTLGYGHLKGRDGDGSLPTVARPDEFKGGRHQSHVILQNIIMTQYNMKQGLKQFGDKGKAAVLVELQQLYDRDVMTPTNKYSLTPEERKGALQYLMFLKEKRCGLIKARGCADGRSQRGHVPKEETSSPTVATEALILTCVVDAAEKRDVATCDIPGAFMQSDMKGKVVMKLEGVMAEVIMKIDRTKYERHAIKENGKDVIYVILNKALYGTLQAALLFWQNLSSQLEKWGFAINPYDFCVANKNINGKQCTIVWHVDDLKVSHVDPAVVTTILNLLDGTYGQEIVGGKRAPLTITRGAIHDYHGMTLNYSEDGVVKIDMRDYVKKVLDEMPEKMDGTATSPAAEHLFQIQDNIELLDETTSEFFHATVAKLLFLCKRGRPDIQTAIAFLCTRVQHPTVHDYNKLSRTIKYLRNTTELVLRLSADNLNVVKWWVDASYGVHHDMKSHTGSVMSLGTGAVYSASKKQKLNTKSSTEAELVGIDDVLPQALWTKYFLAAQGYDTDAIMAQENQSTIRLSDNGKVSSGRGTRHINIRYFFITDKIARKEIAVLYCPTKEMVADFFTKPLQGELFYKFGDQIMGLVPMGDITGDHRSVLDKDSSQSKVSFTAHTNGAQKRPKTGHATKQPHSHPSWADVAKSRPHSRPINRLLQLVK